jgi:hypothetical protein
MTYRVRRHIGCSSHHSKYLGEDPFYVRLSGAGEGSLLLLLLCRWLSLACSSQLFPSEVFTLEVTAQKAQEAQEVDQGVEQTSSIIPSGVDVLAAEREEGDRERCSGGAQGMVRGQEREDSGSFRCS